jgi:hypothetical protein
VIRIKSPNSFGATSKHVIPSNVQPGAFDNGIFATFPGRSDDLIARLIGVSDPSQVFWNLFNELSMWQLFKQKGLKELIEVPFEVTIDKNLKPNLGIDEEIKGPGLLHWRTFKGMIKYNPKNLVGRRGGTNMNLTGKYGAVSGLLSITFDFVNLEIGIGTKRFIEKDDQSGKSTTIFPTLLFNEDKLIGLYFFVGDFFLNMDFTGTFPQRPKSKNKAEFGFYVNLRNPTSSIFTFFAKNGTLSSNGKVKFNN